ncbi:MAG: hypothetical protein ACRDOS_02280 [Gaiellaceae bacterium]
MKRADLDSLQPLEEIMPPDAVAALRARTQQCTREDCPGQAVPIGYFGQAGYAMTAYECEVCGEVEVRR